MSKLSEKQRAKARELFAGRPATIPGTRIIANDEERRQWYARVFDAMEAEGIKRLVEVNEFCDIAGVPD